MRGWEGYLTAKPKGAYAARKQKLPDKVPLLFWRTQCGLRGCTYGSDMWVMAISLGPGLFELLDDSTGVYACSDVERF